MEIAPDISLDLTNEYSIPVITGTRIAVTTVVGSMANGMTKEEVMQEYKLTKEQVERALAYSAELAAKTWYGPPILQGTIPNRYKHCTLESYYPQGQQSSQEFLSQAKAILDCKAFVRAYPSVSYGLLFVGPCGVGKTHLAVGAVKALVEQARVGCLFYDYSDLLKKIRDTYKLHNYSESKLLSPVYDTEILVLDNLGLINSSAWAMQTTSDIITARYNDDKTTIFTSYYADQKSGDYQSVLTDVIGVRMRSLLYEMCKYVEIIGDDYRKQVLRRNANKF